MTAQSHRRTLTDPILDNNPIALQVLGICSALAITRSLWPALIMALAVIAVLVFASTAVSALRGAMPRSVRLLLEVTVIASAVTVADEFLKAFAPESAAVLSVFVGLIITNCIVLGRLEGFALHNPVGASALDALGNGLGYALILLAVAFLREAFGAGTVFDQPLPFLDMQAFEPNAFMATPASAFFIIGLMIWLLRTARGRIEPAEFSLGNER